MGRYGKIMWNSVTDPERAKGVYIILNPIIGWR